MCSYHKTQLCIAEYLFQRNKELCSHNKYAHKVCRNFIHNSQKLDPTELPFNLYVRTVLQPYVDIAAAAAAESLQSCLTLCDPIVGSPPGSPVSGILQARTLEWVAISFSNARKWKVKVKSVSRVWLFESPWTAAYQAPLFMGFSRQEYWSGVPLPFPTMRY